MAHERVYSAEHGVLIVQYPAEHGDTKFHIASFGRQDVAQAEADAMNRRWAELSADEAKARAE